MPTATELLEVAEDAVAAVKPASGSVRDQAITDALDALLVLCTQLVEDAP